VRPAAALFLRFTGLDFDGDEQSPEQLDHYVRWVQRVINQHEGALIQLTTGDKGSYLYAAFGAPIAHDDDIQRAVAAALILRTPPAHCPFIATTQIGVTYGTMRVGAYGGDTRKTYGVLGNETNMAARLMTHAAPGQIVVSAVVADAVRTDYEISALGAHKLKGRAEPQPLFAVERRRQGSGRWQKLYENPLVGREAEVAQLMAAAQSVETTQGQLARVEGSAGLGKSHLVAAFAQAAATVGFRPVVAGGQSTAQGVAYLAIRPWVQSLLGLDLFSDSNSEEQIAQIQQRVAALNPGWALRAPLLSDLLGLAIPDNATTAAFDARLRQEALITLMLEIIQQATRQQRLLLVLEDIHWLDEASQGIVLALARIVPVTPLLLLLVHRPPTRENEPFLNEIAALPDQLYLPLTELPPAGVVALVEGRLQGPIAPLAAALIQLQAQGNPFFTEELVDALVETGQLQQQADQWVLAPTLLERLRAAGCLVRRGGEEIFKADASLSAVDLGIPSTIQGIILARLDRLAEPVKLTVKVASVIGRIFPHELLLRAHPATVADETLEQEVATLLTREFARVETPLPRRSYIFKHNITQEVVYQTLLSDQRHELHLGVATALEALQPESVEALALHYGNSNVEQPPIRTKALHYLDAAGQRAKRDYANETALGYFDRALGLEMRTSCLEAKVEVLHILGRRTEEHAALSALDTQSTTDPFTLSLRWAEYYEAVSSYEQADAQLRTALTLAGANGDAEGLARCRARLGMVAWRQGDYDRAEQIYCEALAGISQEERFADEESDIRYGLGLVYRQQGKFDEAQAEFNRDLLLSRRMENRQSEARALNALGGIEQLQRNYAGAIDYYRQAQAIREAIGDRAGIGASLLNIAQSTAVMGHQSQAEQLLQDALTIQQSLNNRWWEANIWNELGILYSTVGDLPKAERCLQQGLRLSREINEEAIQAYLLCNLGQVLRDRGKVDEAQQILQQGLRLAEQQGDSHLAAIYHSDLALVSLQQHDFSQAIHFAGAALAQFTTLGLSLSATSNLAALAQAYVATGQVDAAQQAAEEALAILDQADGEGIDFPQRDYWMCYEVLMHLGQDALAEEVLTAAHRLLMRQAAQIDNPQMRQSYLTNVPYNRAIVAAWQDKRVESSEVRLL
jgi:predicted ATPase/class 3 adenylate cyclase